jgi:Ca2+/Na+ antiporter
MAKKPTRQTHARRRQQRSPTRTQARQSGWRRVGMVILFLVLAGAVLLALAPGVFLHVVTVTIVVLGILALIVLVVWILLILRRPPEEQRWQTAQRQELVRMEQTASTVGTRPIARTDLTHLHHKEFEHFTVALLTAMDVATDLQCVGGSRDHGIDFRGYSAHGNLIIGQCKKWRDNIGPDLTREFRGTFGLHQAFEGWFVTTAFFTEQAVDEVASYVDRGQIKLVDGDILVEYIQQFWDALPAQWQWRLTECMVQRDQK